MRGLDGRDADAGFDLGELDKSSGCFSARCCSAMKCTTSAKEVMDGSKKVVVAVQGRNANTSSELMDVTPSRPSSHQPIRHILSLAPEQVSFNLLLRFGHVPTFEFISTCNCGRANLEQNMWSSSKERYGRDRGIGTQYATRSS